MRYLIRIPRPVEDLLGWTLLAVVVTGLAFGWIRDAEWFTPAVGVGAGILIVAMIGSAIRDGRRRAAFQRSLPDLTEWDRLHADPGSGIWRISPPCGYEWTLRAPGTGGLDEHGFMTGQPTATRQPVGEAYDPLMDGDEPQTEEQLRAWVVPWIEQVSGGRVVEFVQGWGAPYGPERNLYEWAAFARVEGGYPAAQASASSREPQPNT